MREGMESIVYSLSPFNACCLCLTVALKLVRVKSWREKLKSAPQNGVQNGGKYSSPGAYSRQCQR